MASFLVERINREAMLYNGLEISYEVVKGWESMVSPRVLLLCQYPLKAAALSKMPESCVVWPLYCVRGNSKTQDFRTFKKPQEMDLPWEEYMIEMIQAYPRAHLAWLGGWPPAFYQDMMTKSSNARRVVQMGCTTPADPGFQMELNWRVFGADEPSHADFKNLGKDNGAAIFDEQMRLYMIQRTKQKEKEKRERELKASDMGVAKGKRSILSFMVTKKD
jgi:hypothetical protein